MAAETGSAIRLADVARTLGVTRQTEYRYFPNDDALLIASAMRAADGFVDQVVDYVRGVKDPVTAVVDCVSLAATKLAGDPQLESLLTSRPEREALTPLTSDTAITFVCRSSTDSTLIKSYAASTTSHSTTLPK